MKPVHFPQQNAVLAEDQPEYLPLPVHIVDELERRFISCWELEGDERAEVFKTGRIWLQQMTFGNPLQPQLPTVTSPFEEARIEDATQNRQAEKPSAWGDVLAERQRQISEEGWTPTHDDEHPDGSLARAGACYVLAAVGLTAIGVSLWPWGKKWWKPKGARRDLVRAAALILAEIERMDRPNGAA